MWIEQLASKRASVGAAKCVAISKTPFTKPALKKARKLGVETRNLRRFEAPDIITLAPCLSLHYLCSYNRVSLTFFDSFGDTGMRHELDDELNDLIWNNLKYRLSDQVVNFDDVTRHRSIGEFITNLIDAYYASNISEDFFVPELNKTYIFSFAGECAADIMTGKGQSRRLGGATFWVSFSSFFDCATNLDAATSYSNESGTLDF